tara:strand:- start:184 stop:1305 length:1122 start_codon:yes stop_codon:yes gene_type:complete
MTKQELILLIKECIQETQLKEGVALWYGDMENYKTDTDNGTNQSKMLKKYTGVKVEVDFNFKFDRTEDVILLNSKPRRIEKINLPYKKEYYIFLKSTNKYKEPKSREIRKINAYIPFKFRSVVDIAENYYDLLYNEYNSEIDVNQFAYDHHENLKDLEYLTRSLRHAIKNLKSTDIIEITTKNVDDIKQMVKNGVAKFNNDSQVKISEFDLIIKTPSSAPLNDLIINEISNYTTQDKIISDLVLKNFIDNITIDFQKWKEKEFDTKEDDEYEEKKANIGALKKLKKIVKQNKNFQIKTVQPQSYRQYIKNFLRLNPQIDRKILKLINGGKILIIDDSISSKQTSIEMIKLLSGINPSYIASFMLIDNWKRGAS